MHRKTDVGNATARRYLRLIRAEPSLKRQYLCCQIPVLATKPRHLVFRIVVNVDLCRHAGSGTNETEMRCRRQERPWQQDKKSDYQKASYIGRSRSAPSLGKTVWVIAKTSRTKSPGFSGDTTTLLRPRCSTTATLGSVTKARYEPSSVL